MARRPRVTSISMGETVRTLVIENAEGRAAGIREPVAAAGGREILVRAYLGEAPPDFSDFDAVIISGGPMGVYEMDRPPHEFLQAVADFTAIAIARGRPVLGICLGHQLVAHVTGGRVEPSPECAEAGWSEITQTDEARSDPLFREVPLSFWSFQHHYDAVTALPPDATRLASTPACAVQAFRWGAGPVWGVQFHPEISPERAQRFLEERRARLEARGIDVDAAARQGFAVPQAPRRQVLQNFIRACVTA